MNVKVICSEPGKRDFDNEINKQMIEVLLNVIHKSPRETEINYSFCNGYQRFPSCLFGDEDNYKYDIMWFAGCNLLEWIFTSFIYVDTFGFIKAKMKVGGIVVFTEGDNAKKIFGFDEIKNLSIPIDSMQMNVSKTHDRFDLDKTKFVQGWNSNFDLHIDVINESTYYYYSVPSYRGGIKKKGKKSSSKKTILSKTRVKRSR